MARHRLILLAHGSVDPNWIRPFEDLAGGVELKTLALEAAPAVVGVGSRTCPAAVASDRSRDIARLSPRVMTTAAYMIHV